MEWIVRRRRFKEETTTHILPLIVWNLISFSDLSHSSKRVYFESKRSYNFKMNTSAGIYLYIYSKGCVDHYAFMFRRRLLEFFLHCLQTNWHLY
jgi:hypothetical protein